MLADEASCVEKHEFLSLTLQYFNSHAVIIAERTVSTIFVPNTLAETLRDVIKKLVIELGLAMESCHGQGYDGANNMSGCKTGVATRFLEDYLDMWAQHCMAHCLNFVLETVIEHIPEMADCLGNTKIFYCILSASLKWVEKFEQRQKEGVKYLDSIWK